MSMTTTNLSGVLLVSKTLSPDQLERLREQWRRAYIGANRVPQLSASFGHYTLPLPFCWGPNGPFYLLAALLAGYGLIVAAFCWIVA